MQPSSRTEPSVARFVAAAFVGTCLALSIFVSGASHAQTRVAAFALHRATSSSFFIDGNFDSVADVTLTFGSSSDTGLLADVTGTGSRVPIVFNNGIWKFDTNRDGADDSLVGFGAPGDKPLIGDIDRDGRDDLVLYRNGTWYVSAQRNGTVSHTFFLGGVAQDVPLLGDVDGDGNLDLVIYRDGLWYVSLNRTNVVHRTYRFGGTSDRRDVPLLLDYDGDGKDDLVIFRNGMWHVALNTTAPWSANAATPPALATANVVVQFGQGGDTPLYYGRGAVNSAEVEAARLLQQATFGPTQSEIARVLSMGVTAWVDDQLAQPMSSYASAPWFPASRPANTALPYCTYAQYTTTNYSASSPCRCDDQPSSTNRCARDVYSIFQLQKQFFVNALTAPDQLRHRVAWALSQIIVTSAAQDPILYANRDYQQLLMQHAFGNFGTLLTQVTVNPFMGNYLDMVNNRKANATGTRQPNENYAREILQLFSIGTFELRPDGTLILDQFGNPIATYDQADITELSRVYTGWVYPPIAPAAPALNSTVNYLGQMVPIEIEHDTGSKRILDLGSTPAGIAAAPDVTFTNNAIFSHPNVGPFIGKQLIQHLVTSNPSPAYVGRITAVFNNNGSGVRGDLKAVVRAILLDPEARAPRNPAISSFGKLKEPVLYVTGLLRALGAVSDGVDPIVRTSAMGQNVYTPPTVFNYYPADYVLPGTELAGPPFGIFDATTYFTRANWVYNQITLAASCSGTVCGPNADTTVVSAVGTKVDYVSISTLANDPAALVDRVDLLLFQRTMPTFVKQQIINAVSAYPVTSALDRARTAVYLAAISPRYQTEF
ncbi:MAG TPA: DUF1800 family protein [Casimicrobiaceae bacterium]|nr:DUF1800 family protein [Casimicrobiaceae bacterium]